MQMVAMIVKLCEVVILKIIVLNYLHANIILILIIGIVILIVPFLQNFKKKKNLVNVFVETINFASENIASDNTKRIEKVLIILDNKYTSFLTSQTGSIDVYTETIDKLTGIFIEFAGDEGGIFTILNCLFIGRNVKVILKYLKKALGTNIYTVGVCLLITGIAMCVSIAFTILLNIIINMADTISVEGEGVPELGNNGNINGNDPNFSPGNYDTEKVNYRDNYNQFNYNNENLNGGIRVINYNN